MSGGESDPRSSLRLILGLGNPGERYAGTRHNIGFEVVAELARRSGMAFDREVCGARIARKGDLLLAQPQTFMNRSGYAGRCLLEAEQAQSGQMLVVFDDVNLALGTLRLRGHGSPGGHRGLESMLENLGTDLLPRLRLGVASDTPPGGADLADFVLAPFAAAENAAVKEMITRAADACELWAAAGLEKAMSTFNGKPRSSGSENVSNQAQEKRGEEVG